MAVKTIPVAGSKFYIGTAPVDLPDDENVTAADFASVTWLEVKQYETMGSAGDAAENIATNLINRRRTINQKGTRQGAARTDNFALNLDDPGQQAMIAAEQTDYNYPFRVVLPPASAPVPKSATVTISNATPGVVTWTGHGLAANTAVVFTTTGALPAGLTAGTTYYVKTVLTADTFTVSATAGGAAIDTTDAGSGTHTGTTEPSPAERLFMGMVTGAEEGNGNANTVMMLNCSITPNTNYVRVAALG